MRILLAVGLIVLVLAWLGAMAAITTTPVPVSPVQPSGVPLTPDLELK